MAVVLAPSDAELRGALDTVSALRNSGYEKPIVLAIEAGDRRDLLQDPRAVEARKRGASATVSQALSPEHILYHATLLLPDEVQATLRKSSPPFIPSREPLRYGQLRIEGNRTFIGKRELELEPSERDTLIFLLENRGRAVSRVDYQQQKGVCLSEAAFRTRISNLRGKLGDKHRKLIQSAGTGLYGIGI